MPPPLTLMRASLGACTGSAHSSGGSDLAGHVPGSSPYYNGALALVLCSHRVPVPASTPFRCIPVPELPWSSCCVQSCALRPCGPLGALEPAASARAGLTTLILARCLSRLIAGRRVYEPHGIWMQARQMFEGEMVSLEALRSTGLVRAPQPMKVIDLPGGGAAFVMEYLKMKSLSSQASKLGGQMADLHLYNQKIRDKSKMRENTIGHGAEDAAFQGVTKFGFHTVTCCGFIPQVNEWQDDWPTFFTQHRLQAQLDLIEKDYADREARELWSRLQVKIPDLFSGLEIVPALLHGDLWSGNVAEDDQGPIVYDPASFYGHSEFELAIALMFGGFPRSFFTAYHQKIPKAPGFDKRLLLYQLFNYLNHWNHFGLEYRSPCLGTMRKLLR
uniref:fructosamine-3-kinase isoform X1 n=1 Tax=Jaculus jaculus TaxID=51337 RepID=UPI001E1B50CB|nr:fructosamine-3-kinase isoform X1 [Jaculus jaculus]